MKRRTSTPWIYRWSRHMIGAIATAGALETAFLTIAEYTGGAASVCPTTGCKQVLESAYATVFGVPLTVFGLLAYGVMAVMAFAPLAINPENRKQQRSQAENITWLGMFALGTAMLVFSSNLMYVMLVEIKAICPYCIASAIFSGAIFFLTVAGRDWEDLGQLFFIGIVVGMVTLITLLGIYANVDKTGASGAGTLGQTATVGGETGLPIMNESGPAEIALAEHLTKIGAKEYGAYWCSHCHEQKELFGKQAFSRINYIECDEKGKNAQPQLCKDAGVKGFPTWEINGQFYLGVQSLEKLADVSGYSGPRDFKQSLPRPSTN